MSRLYAGLPFFFFLDTYSYIKVTSQISARALFIGRPKFDGTKTQTKQLIYERENIHFFFNKREIFTARFENCEVPYGRM